MGSLLHEPAAPSEPENVKLSARNARFGLAFFALYFAVYAGFVGINAFRPDWMAVSLSGISIAVWYGLGLIVSAMVLALLYTWACQMPLRGDDRGAA